MAVYMSYGYGAGGMQFYPAPIPSYGQPPMGQPMYMPGRTVPAKGGTTAAKKQNAPAATSIYASIPNLPTSNTWYTPGTGTSLYASTPVAPSVKTQVPSLDEEKSTVGLMLWPGKDGELIITDIKENTSAAGTVLAIGDVIVKIDETSIEGLPATEAYKPLAGPNGSMVTITTKRVGEDGSTSTHTAELTRDVSAVEANKITQKSIETSGASLNTQADEKKETTRQLSPAECQMYGVPFGSVWTVGKSSSQHQPTTTAKPPAKTQTAPAKPAPAAPKPAPAAAKPAPAAAKPAPAAPKPTQTASKPTPLVSKPTSQPAASSKKPAANSNSVTSTASANTLSSRPQPSSVTRSQNEGRLLTHQECMMLRVPYGSRFMPSKQSEKRADPLPAAPAADKAPEAPSTTISEVM
ncbi:hypothetical protein GUITHDRAFT_150034 [Guillardia theta CCMP2712]|uniref:PDZ domain-containing protein n=1 Tax=Guillardia theta (strain CCMP2712) TaxID=905079 RepID=L1K1M7_GUITC|nr:hypothetical protein GUITHDRAFT_150034 [Guillardia theta CCMP2712]EKX54517.1 hypothetical protein GUITHDRAFT_150034 [Guillardia theta CCMP2712]|mmetsp:Transcript_44130/g.139249  ORF Transcript_44130/g.139249 Transcript_44130/m.139249 type:complete len:409 (-) Transcript_44130:58-1284(-)|eukprot:XP_005841497.1 hypothetical protein GUITHDRAFT_150034 [Guillardia theta CCMP2712]